MIVAIPTVSISKNRFGEIAMLVYPRRIRAIVSTISIPSHLLRSKAGSATDQPVGGQFWTPIPRLRGLILHAE